MKRPDPSLIESYLSHQCSAEEAAIVLEWLATPEGQAYYEQYLDGQMMGWEMNASQLEQNDHQKTLAGIYQRISTAEKVKPIRNSAWYWAAASIILLIGTVWSITYLTNDLQQVATAYGETKKVELPDGTVVFLNANSSLTYQEEMPREVELKGEAYFQVFHTRDDAPFRVITSDLTVNVLGTEFNVNTRHEKTDVVLNEGKVKLDFVRMVKSKSLLMEPGEKVSYSQKSGTYQIKLVDPEAYTLWKSGTLNFDHTPLREVFQLLRDLYGVEIILENKQVLDKVFTGQVNQELDVIMTLIEKSFDLKSEKVGDTIYLR
jgi:ferric-dicitrate binding protein FerR (iron transport regulator)